MICTLLIVSISVANSKDVQDIISSIGLKKFRSNNQKIIKSNQRKGLKVTFTELTFNEGDLSYEIEKSTPIARKNFEFEKKNNSLVIVGSYNDLPTPYQGEITNRAKCPNMFRPEVFEGNIENKNPYVLISSINDKNRNYGVCHKADEKFKACTLFYYDVASESSYKIKITGPLKSNCVNLSKKFFRMLR